MINCVYCSSINVYVNSRYTRKDGKVITQYRCKTCKRYFCDNLEESKSLNKLEKSLAKQLYKDGYAVANIAILLQVSKPTIYRWLNLQK